VRTNFIQADPGLSASVDRSALPFQFAAPGANNFASALQSAGAAAPATTRAELLTVAGREKSAEKKTSENSNGTPPARVTPAMGPALNADAKTAPLIVIKPETILPVLQANPGSSGLIPLTVKNSRSDDHTGLGGAAQTAGEETSVGRTIGLEQVFQQAATPALNGAAVAAKPATGTDPALSDNAGAAPVNHATPPAAGDARTQVTPLDEIGTGRQISVVENPAGANLNNANPDASLPSASAGLDPLPHLLLPLTAEFAGNVGKSDPQLAIPPPSAMPQHSLDPASGAAAVAGVDPNPSEATTPSFSGSKRESPEALPSPSLASSSVASSMSSSTGVSKPISPHAALAMKPVTTTPDADARVKESSAARATTSVEHTAPKTSEAFPSFSDMNAPPLSPGAAPGSPVGQLIPSAPPGTTASPVLAQVSPVVNQDGGSRGASLPAAERQAPSASLPASLPASSTVEVARLVAGVGQSEMHIGLRTQAFGSVEVHTVVRDSQVGLTVGSERGDLRSLLAPEVSGLQTSFRQQDLRFDSIHFLETSAGTTAGFSGGADSHSRSSSQQHASTEGLFTIQNTQQDPAELDVGAGSRVRLNVHA
jgi:hypothetical protein